MEVDMSIIKQKMKIRVNVRWMIKKDINRVLDIEEESFEFPWSINDFFECLNHKKNLALVAEHDGQVIGFMIINRFAFIDRHIEFIIHLLNFAVHPDWRKRGVGKQMISELIADLPKRPGLKKIIAKVREKNLDAQLFLKKLKFRAVRIIHDCYEECPEEDVYVMRYLDKSDPTIVNRIAKYPII